MADAGIALGEGSAVGGAVIARDGTKVTGRGGMGGYTRITTTTIQWTEVGDTLPGQPIYDTVVPFFPSHTQLTDIEVVGGRSFVFDHTVDLIGITDITEGVFLAQVRNMPNGVLLGTMHAEVTGPLTVRFTMNPHETQMITTTGHTRGVWDAEMRLDGLEYTIVPQSKAVLVQGVSQGDASYPDPQARSQGEAFNAMIQVVEG